MNNSSNLSRDDRAKINILSSFATQIVSVFCAFIIPRLIMSHYGSEQYGAVSSITQFLGYITLFEGGICGVARAALYKALANDNYLGASKIIQEVDAFFKKLSIFLIIYVVILSFTFKYISNVTSLDYVSSVLLVLAISISTVAQYLFGIKYVVFLQAAQRAYIINALTIFSTVANTILTMILVLNGKDLIIVKFASSIVFLIRPLMLNLYVKSNYKLVRTKQKNNELTQKWEALGQHIAYFIHTNTDILVLTIFTDLKNVAIYSIYNMIVIAIQNLIYGFTNGMEPLFGELLARNEHLELNEKVSYYETLVSLISTIVFLTTATLIVPFVSVYTKGLTDANYYQPLFSFLLVISVMIYCVRLPYHAVVVAAGKFKETRVGAYGEAIINLVLSVLLVSKIGLIGVTIGTILGNVFRFAYYIKYLGEHILRRDYKVFAKRICYTFVPMLVIFLIEQACMLNCSCSNYIEWVLLAGVFFVVNSAVIISINYLGYRSEVRHMMRGVFNMIKR